MSEGEKRKKAGNEAVSGRQKKAREVDGKEAITAVTDDEVEEFYAILRRIKTAVNYFKGGNDDVVEGRRSQSRWRTTLEEEIIQEVSCVKGEGRREENIEEIGSLDLNISPPAE